MDEQKRCPFCGEQILQIAIKCKHCGSDLNRSTPQTPAPGTSPGDTIPAWAVGGAAIPVGTELREYRIGRRIGTGGMGEVYAGEHTYTGQKVALKAVHPGLMADQAVRRRFLEEGRVMASLKHPGIVVLHNFFEDLGRFFLVMEYIEGPTLADLLEAGPLPVQQALDISEKVLEALQYAHTLPDPVVHRDIKPANIMIEPGGRVVVMDFGIARALGREKLTRTGGTLGTYEYMSPEQVQGQDVTPAADLYAWGVVLYQMLAGRVPFPQETDSGFEVMQAHVQKPPPTITGFREDLPVELQAVLQAALAKAPAHRFQTARDFQVSLAGGGTIAAETVPTPAPRTPVADVLSHEGTKVEALAPQRSSTFYWLFVPTVLAITTVVGLTYHASRQTGTEYWKKACAHSIELMQRSDALKDVPKETLDKALEGAAKECLEEFEKIGGDEADEAAKCVLKLGSFDPIEFARCEPKKK